MNRHARLTTAAALLFAAVQASGADWPPPQLGSPVIDKPLQRVATGKAYYLKVIHVYDAALYTADGRARFDAQTLDAGLCLQLRYLRTIRADQLIEAADTALASLSTPPTPAQQAGIATIHAAYRQVDEGDRYTLCTQGTRTWLRRDDRDGPGETVAQVDQPGFGALYLGIWLGPHALSPKLRDALLAQSSDD